MPDSRRLDQALDRGQPLGEQRVAVHGSVEAGDAAEEARVLLVPRDALARRVGVGEPVDSRPHRGDHLEARHHGGRALILGEHGGGLGGEPEEGGGAVVGDVAVGRLGGEPLLDVAGGDAGAFGELAGGRGLEGAQRSPEAEPITEVHEDRVVGRGLVGPHLSRELLELAKSRTGDSICVVMLAVSFHVAPGWRRR